MAPLLREIRDNRLLWLLVFVPLVFVARTGPARVARAAVRALGAGHRPARGAAQPRHRVGRRQDRRLGRRPAQCDARQPDRTGDRAHRARRRPISAGEGNHRRRRRHQRPVHAGRVLPPGRAEASRPGVQPRQCAPAGRPPAAGDDRPDHAVGDRPGRFGLDRAAHGEAQPRPGGAADRHLRARHAVLAQDAPRGVRERRERTRAARRPGRSASPSRHWPASPCWSPW